MPSQSINTDIIKLPDTITQRTLSKAFALLVIGVHEMIDWFSGVDDFFCWGGGGGGGGTLKCFAREGLQW